MIDNYNIDNYMRRYNTFVGVILDNKFTWKYYIDHIYEQVCRTIGLIAKARIILDIVLLFYI